MQAIGTTSGGGSHSSTTLWQRWRYLLFLPQSFIRGLCHGLFVSHVYRYVDMGYCVGLRCSKNPLLDSQIGKQTVGQQAQQTTKSQYTHDATLYSFFIFLPIFPTTGPPFMQQQPLSFTSSCVEPKIGVRPARPLHNATSCSSSYHALSLSRGVGV